MDVEELLDLLIYISFKGVFDEAVIEVLTHDFSPLIVFDLVYQVLLTRVRIQLRKPHWTLVDHHILFFLAALKVLFEFLDVSFPWFHRQLLLFLLQFDLL